VVDAAHINARMDAFEQSFPNAVRAYAAKAFLVPALAAAVAERGWWLDVVSAGEARLALEMGVPAEHLIVHGNYKTPDEVLLAVVRGAGRVVVDHPAEVTQLAEAARLHDREVDVLLRLNVDIDVETHPKVRTAGSDVHFGMVVSEAASAVRAATGPVHLRGVHLHLGSQLRDPDVYPAAMEAVAEFVEVHRAAFPDVVDLDVGGGMAVPYVRSDPVVPVGDYAAAIERGAYEAERMIGPVRILIEPGRAIVANAGVTVYRIGVRKPGPEGVPFLAVDGGISDNPRPALYGAEYEAVLARRADEPHDHPFRVVGRHCETGDTVVPHAWLPADADHGELLVVPATGAYGFSMASRYNLVSRPPVIFVESGRERVVVERDDSLPGLGA
jgi:diaminopimelate decarboxylase